MQKLLEIPLFFYTQRCKKKFLIYRILLASNITQLISIRIINSITRTSWLPTTILLHRYPIPVRTTFLIHRSYRTHRALRNYRSPRLYSHQIAQPRTSIRRTRPLTWPARSILRHFSSSPSISLSLLLSGGGRSFAPLLRCRD